MVERVSSRVRYCAMVRGGAQEAPLSSQVRMRWAGVASAKTTPGGLVRGVDIVGLVGWLWSEMV